MGKRKKSSRKPQGPKKREPLQNTFNCLFCNHENAVTCKLDKKAGIGLLSCSICGQQFQSIINYLSHPVDVYSDWIDACDEIANPKPAKRASSQRSELQRGSASSQNESRGQSVASPGGDEDGDGKLSDLEDEDLEDEDEDLRITHSASTRRRQNVLSDDEDEEEEEDV